MMNTCSLCSVLVWLGAVLKRAKFLFKHRQLWGFLSINNIMKRVINVLFFLSFFIFFYLFLSLFITSTARASKLVLVTFYFNFHYLWLSAHSIISALIFCSYSNAYW